MKHLVIIFAFLLTSCASIGIGTDTINNINNGTIIINQTKTDTITRYVDQYAESWRNTYDNASEIIGESMADRAGADWSITAYFGQTMIDSSKYGKPYTYGVALGGEGYLYSSERHFRAGLAPSIRYLLIDESAYRTLHFVQIELGFKLSFGNMRNRGYGMGILSTNVATVASESVPRYGKYPAQINFSAAMLGMEVGYTHITRNKHSVDVFLRFGQPPFSYSSTDTDITVCLFGLRMNV